MTSDVERKGAMDKTAIKVTLEMTLEEAEEYRDGLADILCWVRGFNAGKREGVDGPMSIDTATSMSLRLEGSDQQSDMKPRPSFSAHKRAAIFRDNGGICHICTRKIAPAEEWEVEHVKARGFKGPDTDDNLRPAHVDCHAGKTKKDRAIMADADRALLRHAGLKKPSRSWGRGKQRSFGWRTGT